MSLFKFKKKQSILKPDKKEVNALVQKELEPYIKRADLQEYLAIIEKDEKRRQLWNSLPLARKIKLLRYVLSQKGEQKHEKPKKFRLF